MLRKMVNYAQLRKAPIKISKLLIRWVILKYLIIPFEVCLLIDTFFTDYLAFYVVLSHTLTTTTLQSGLLP